MSSVFIDNKGLYRKTVQSAVLVHRPHYSARLMRFGSRGPSKFFSQLRHPNAFTEIEWADGERGLGIAMSTLVSEKNRELLQVIVVYRQRGLQTVTSLGVVSLVFRRHDLLCSPENRSF